MDNLTVIAGSSDDPPVTLKPLIIIIDLVLHTKLIISKFKRSVRDLNPRGWRRGLDFNFRFEPIFSLFSKNKLFLRKNLNIIII